MANAGATAGEVERRAIRVGSHPLTRGIGTLGVVIFGVQCISMVLSGWMPFSWVTGVFPGVNLIGVLTFAAIPSILHALMFSSMGAAMPRSGADYVFTSRTLGGVAGFLYSWSLILITALSIGPLVLFVPRTIISEFAATMGVVERSTEFDRWATLINQPENLIIIASIVMVVAFIISMTNVKVLVRIMAGGLGLGLVGWVVLLVMIFIGPHDGFPTAINSFLGAGTYNAHMVAARTMGMVPNTSASMAAYAGMLVSFWLFFGAYSTSMFAGEVKKPGRTLALGSVLAIVICWVVGVAAVVLTTRIVPQDWISAESYLAVHGYQGRIYPSIVFYAGLAQPQLEWLIVAGISWALSLISLIAAYLFYASRAVFAWARDGLMPLGLTYVNPHSKSPLLALLLVAVIAEIGVIDGVQGQFIEKNVNFVVFAVATQIVPAVAAVVWPFLKNRAAETRRGILNWKLGPIPVGALLGVGVLGYLLWLLLNVFEYPDVAGYVTVGRVVAFFALPVSGLIVYIWRAIYMRRQGVDLRDTFSKLPEE